MYLLHSANGASAIVHLDPDHQPVLRASRHLVEELQTLKLPLGVEGAGLQQSGLLRLPSHGAEVHEVPSIYKVRTGQALPAHNLVISVMLSDLRIISNSDQL